MDCAQNQNDISLCSGFNEAIKLCKQQNGKYIYFLKTHQTFSTVSLLLLMVLTSLGLIQVHS